MIPNQPYRLSLQALRGVCFALCLCIGAAAGTACAAAPSVERPTAVLRALDKVTARVEEIEVQTEKPYKFGTIFITVHSCRTTTPEETPESAAFMEMTEFKSGQTEATVFKGWMFASSPALSAMEHPVYDVWLIGCKAPPEVAPAPAAPSVVNK